MGDKIRHRRLEHDISGEVMDSPLDDSVSGVVHEFFAQDMSKSGTRSVKTAPLELNSIQSDLSIVVGDPNDGIEDFNTCTTSEAAESCRPLPTGARPAVEKTHSVNKNVGSVASTVIYAFYLNRTLENDEFFTVPVINMK
ncbi:hypothetical protein SLEP1_g37239 [Rubroshorea leprosula]|uniref:Uncharacterized protein n=1 Tax=Rubroshorea leprosula TaxID=152421 RepID=A0AAV5KTZ0_9ROSI|nr:hypothetical protein SLEP1_g37239 [Rubroshorea leprosula]